MTRTIMSALFAVLALLVCAQQSDTNITGHVVDSETGEHLPYAIITVRGTKITTTTDATGHYAMRNLKPGSYVVTAASVGMATEEIKVNLKPGTTTELNFNLHPDAMLLDQVVVTGSKSETKRRFSPALVSVLDNAMLQLVNSCTLADGLNFQPGVRVENDCQNCGFTQVRINGLDGHYSQILMNSRPVFSALAGVYGLEQIPANMIDRIEVMRGGGSALFGSSAIGGTINVITKDPETNYAEVSHSLSSIGLSSALDNNTTFNASVVSNNSDLGLMLYGQSRNRSGYDHDGDGFTEVPTLSSQTIGTRASARFSQDARLRLEYHTTHEYRRGGDRLDQPPHYTLIAEEVEHNIHGGEASLDLWDKSHLRHLNVFGALQGLNRKSYYGSDKDPNAYGRTSDLTATGGAQYTGSIERLLFMPAELIGGVEYTYNYLHDVTLGYDHDQRQSVNIYSAYAQNEWRNDRWGFLFGARIDKHSMIKAPVVSPRLNLRYNPSSQVNFRLSYSTGFRSPQAYDEDFHIAIVGGERLVTVLDPNLKPERSQSVSASADLYGHWGRVQANLLVEGFYTDLRDVFALRMLAGTDAAGNAVQQRYNGGGARVVGANLEGRLAWPKWNLQAGLTWQRSRYKQPEKWSDNPDVPSVTRMFRTPDLYGFITANYNATKKLSFALSGTYTGSMLVQHIAGAGTPIDVAVTTPNFFDMTIKANYEVPVFKSACVDFSAGISNIFNSYQRDFDRGPLRDSGYIYGPALPRTAFVSASVHI